MKLLLASTWLLGTQIWRDVCLKVNRLDTKGAPLRIDRSPPVNHAISAWVANSSRINNTKHSFAVAASERYCKCNSSSAALLRSGQRVNSSCSVDSDKIKTELHDNLVLIFGCSLDVQAIGYFCQAANGISMPSIVNMAPASYLAHCTVGDVTFAYVFHPGASPPPYAADYNPFGGTTRDIIQRSHGDLIAKFGREPTAIVVDASLWDISNWWGKIGRPPYPYPVTAAFPLLEQWCNKDVPQLLQDVATMYPHSPIAFRTAPTIFSGHDNLGLNPQIIDGMVDCVGHYRDPFGHLYGKYSLIDYHQFVDTMLQNAGMLGSAYYADPLHPGSELSLLYLNNVLNWVRGLR